MVRQRSTTHRRPGQSMVEFVLVLPVFLTLILGAVCVLQILLVQDTVAAAARAAAHQAALAGGSEIESGELATAAGAVADAARSVLDGGMAVDATKAAIAVSCTDVNTSTPGLQCRRYQPITITITYADTPWVPLPPLFTEVRAQVSATRVSENDQQ